MHAQDVRKGGSGRRRNAISRPSGVLGGRRTIGSGDEGMIGMVVDGRVGWVSGAESSVLAFLAERGHCGRPQFRII